MEDFHYSHILYELVVVDQIDLHTLALFTLMYISSQSLAHLANEFKSESVANTFDSSVNFSVVRKHANIIFYIATCLGIHH